MIGIRSARDIEPGEELTFNYFESVNLEDIEGSAHECLCGQINCKGFLPKLKS